MKLKYYLRGLGIGIIVAVIIMMLAFKIHGSNMTDEQIIDRAEQLGMVMPENGTVADQPTEADGEDSTDPLQSDSQDAGQGENDDTASGNGSEDGGTKKSGDDETVSSGNGSEPEPVEQDGQQPKTGSTNQTGDTVTFVIAPGEFSDTLSKNLAAAGLISDAEAYNNWLMDTDYDNFLQPGTYTIPVGASDEEIAKILTTKPGAQQ